MSFLSPIVDPLRRLELDGFANLSPAYPPVAIELDRREMVIVRLKPGRRSRPKLEAFQVRPVPEQGVGATLLRPGAGPQDEVIRQVRALFESTGTRPGKVSLILPDNLAKISIVTLPERPTSRKQLFEVLRFKLRRSVPFRLEDAALTYQILPGDEGGVNVLVALMLRSVVEQHENMLAAIGARPGLVDLSTPCLFNLWRHTMAKVTERGGDVALLNCAGSYFTLLIARGERLLFFRCKSLTSAAEAHAGNGVMARELASSLSYYEEKLKGTGIVATYVRSVARPMDEVAEVLRRVGLDRVEVLQPEAVLDLPPGVTIDPEIGQRIAPAVGAAARRGL